MAVAAVAGRYCSRCPWRWRLRSTSPPEVLSVTEANLMLLGTAIGATAFLIAVRQAARQVRAHWAQIGVRAAGSWIGAAAILALALRFVR